MEFEELFYDIRTSQPREGDVLAIYRTNVELLSCPLKRDIILTLHRDGCGEYAVGLLEKIGKAPKEEAIKVCRNMLEDLLNGMQWHKVDEKPYVYTCEMMFYTKLENIPNSPHWTWISLEEI